MFQQLLEKRRKYFDDDEDITLKNAHDAEMFDTRVLDDEEVFTEKDVVEKEVSTADPVTTAGEVVTTASVEQSESTTRTRPQQLPSKDKAEEEEDVRLAREKDKKEQEANVALIEEWNDIQAKIEADQEKKKVLCSKKGRGKEEQTTYQISTKKYHDYLSEKYSRMEAQRFEEQVLCQYELQSMMEVNPDEEEVAVDAIPLATKPQSIMLKNFDREDFETLWKLVKAKHGSTRLEEGYERVLWVDLKTMFEHHIEDTVWRNLQGQKVLVWKLFDSCGVHFLRVQSMHIFMLVEKRYPLTSATITDMLNKKPQADHWNEIVTAAKVRVTAAKQNLVLFITTAEKIKTAGRVYAHRDEIKDLSEKG
ncbi:hypothetical protein Tco_0359408 [Tanacetum coccineum]